MTQETSTPTHIGFIVDGNRRWAKQHNLPAYEGHLAGHVALREVLRTAVEAGVRFITFYVFSTENWKRSQDEVNRLMGMTIRFSKEDLQELIKQEVRVRVLGARQELSDKVRSVVEDAEEKTKHFTRATVAFCFNYGGQREIIQAAQQCMADGLQPGEITEDAIRSRLYCPDIPDVDIVVRTSGEQRLSNFMLWRAAYSEFLFLDKMWPDMRASDVHAIIKEYTQRNRRFGGN